MLLRITLTLLLCSSAWASRVFIEDAGTPAPGLEPATLRGLLRAAVGEMGHTLVDSAGKAEFTLRIKAVRLGSAYLIEVRKVLKNQPVSSVGLKALHLEEVDTVVERLARAAVNGEDSSAPHVDNVTSEETVRGTNRKPSRGGVNGAVGMAFLKNLGMGGPAIDIAAGWGWTMGPLGAGFRVDYTFDTDLGFDQQFACLGDVALNVSWYLLSTDVSPFLSVEYGMGFAHDNISRGTYGGMLVGGTAGLAVLRTSEVHIEVSGRVAAIVESALSGRTPLVLAFRVGASF